MFFDTKNVAEIKDDFAPVPPGKYRLLVDSSEHGLTKSGLGKLVKVMFSVVDGKYHGRKIFAYFNIENQNPVAQNIGRAQLKKMLAAMGLTQSFNTENEFHAAIADKTVMGEVTVKDDQNGTPRNNLKDFSKKPDNHTILNPTSTSGTMDDLPF